MNGQQKNLNSIFSPKNKAKTFTPLNPIKEITEKKKKVSEKVEELNRKPFEFKNCFVETKFISIKPSEGNQFDFTSLSPNRRDYALFKTMKEEEKENKEERDETKRKEEELRRKEEDGRRREEEEMDERREVLRRREEEDDKIEEEEGGFTSAIKKLDEF